MEINLNIVTVSHSHRAGVSGLWEALQSTQFAKLKCSSMKNVMGFRITRYFSMEVGWGSCQSPPTLSLTVRNWEGLAPQV